MGLIHQKFIQGKTLKTHSTIASLFLALVQELGMQYARIKEMPQLHQYKVEWNFLYISLKF